MWPLLLHNWFTYSYCRTPSTQRHLKNETESTKDLDCSLYFFPSPCLLLYFPTSEDNMSLKVLGLSWIALWDKYLTLPTLSLWASVFSAASSSTGGVWRSFWQTKRAVWTSSSALRCADDSSVLTFILFSFQVAIKTNKQKKHFPSYAMCGSFIFLSKGL